MQFAITKYSVSYFYFSNFADPYHPYFETSTICGTLALFYLETFATPHIYCTRLHLPL